MDSERERERVYRREDEGWRGRIPHPLEDKLGFKELSVTRQSTFDMKIDKYTSILNMPDQRRQIKE